MKIRYVILFLAASSYASAQSVNEKWSKAVLQWEATRPMQHASMSVLVMDAQSAKTVYEHQAEIGLAPASCQKLFTSVAAFDLLGPAYRYRTSFGYEGKIDKGVLYGNLVISASGDPTLGSWRYPATQDAYLLGQWVSALKDAGISTILGEILFTENHWDLQSIPDGWIWEDIGNYYGAGASALNWRENQYDLYMMPAIDIGGPATIAKSVPAKLSAQLTNRVLTGKANSGDQTCIYFNPSGGSGYISGTIPSNQKPFIVSGAIWSGEQQLLVSLTDTLAQCGISVRSEAFSFAAGDSDQRGDVRVLLTHQSPSLDSINYWFLKKSINLYGEALIKTLAFEKNGFASTRIGTDILEHFWAEHGVEPGAMHICDGSGLSPQNRITTRALVQVLHYARGRPWFPSFYEALPQINGIKMKSGSIERVKSYAGYHTSKAGRKYEFAIIVNNYDGSSADVVKTMFALLDLLK